MLSYHDIESILQNEAAPLLEFSTPKINKNQLHLPSPIGSTESLHQATALSCAAKPPNPLPAWPSMETGYLSILPVDQGSNTLPEPLLPLTPSISTRKTCQISYRRGV